MTEKFSTEIELKIKWFQDNFAEIRQRIAEACNKVGKSEKDIILLAATKTVPNYYRGDI